ncbi:phenoloxidase-activating factor 3-like [Chironomus tepperi]|uniref:phenoloxidase-activating factor 3-like n=1 Tax=Chironomus tepperi TaxID=113505 RepID=UPI00391F06FB
MLCWREFLGMLILFDIGWISSAPTLCLLPDSFNKGHCVATKECTSVNLTDSIISPDVFEDFTKRRESCAAFGPKLVCCELQKYITHLDPVTMKSPMPVQTSASTVSITTPTTIIQTTAESTTQRIETPEVLEQKIELDDITKHKNFKLFDPKSCGKSFLKRVANGDDAEVLEFPWIVRFKYQGKRRPHYGCAGTLISEYYVLTAAHCILTNDNITMIRLGEYNETSIVDCNEDMQCADPVQDVEVASMMTHPNYDPVKVMNDIGLVRLAKPAKLSQNNINTICLPLEEVSTKKLGPNYQVIGWGATENTTSYPILQKAYVPPVSISECEQKFAAIKKLSLSDNQICAGGVALIDACRGDSGGPLQAPGKVNKMIRVVQYGIVSYGVKTCGEESYPGIYTNVQSYLTWILDNMS